MINDLCKLLVKSMVCSTIGHHSFGTLKASSSLLSSANSCILIAFRQHPCNIRILLPNLHKSWTEGVLSAMETWTHLESLLRNAAISNGSGTTKNIADTTTCLRLAPSSTALFSKAPFSNWPHFLSILNTAHRVVVFYLYPQVGKCLYHNKSAAKLALSFFSRILARLIFVIGQAFPVVYQ